jgi:hypothetical protein
VPTVVSFARTSSAAVSSPSVYAAVAPIVLDVYNRRLARPGGSFVRWPSCLSNPNPIYCRRKPKVPAG